MSLTEIYLPEVRQPSRAPGPWCPELLGADTASCFPRPTCVLAAAAGDDLHVITVAAVAIADVTSGSIVVSVRAHSRIHRLVARSGAFTVGLLAASQQSLAIEFARPGRPMGISQLAGLRWSRSPASGTPLLEGLAAWLDCDVSEILSFGSSVLLLGVARAASGREKDDVGSLVRLDGRYVPVRLGTHHERR